MEKDTSQQGNINDINDVILFQLDITSKQSKIYSQRIMDSEGMGITIEQWVLLKIIQESKKLSQKEIANKSFRDPASITRTLDLLTKKGFIKREQVASDRRQHGIVLTEIGEQFVAKHMELINDMRRKSVEGFSDDEIKTFYGMLKRVKDNFS